MKIRTRLSMEFTLLTAGFMLLVFLAIYLLFSNYLRRDFFSRLNDRALVTANVYLEKDELTRRSFTAIQKKYLQILPEEQSFIYNENNQGAFISDTSGLITRDLINSVRSRGRLEFNLGDKQGVGINYADNEGDFVIVTIANNSFGRSQLQNLLLVLAGTYLAGLVIIFLLSRRFAQQALLPIVQINKDLRQIRSSNLHKRITVPQNKDEINEVANNFNDLLERLEHSFDLQRSFVNNASHELRTPLTSIIGELEVILSRRRDPGEYEEAMKSVLTEAEKLTTILNQLFELSSYEGNEARLKLGDMIANDFIASLEAAWKEENVQFHLVGVDTGVNRGNSFLLTANQLLLETAVNNILKNAVKFSGDKTVFVHTVYHPNELEIAVTDQGVGIEPADLDKIFQPFYRADTARTFAGNGIGLSIAQRIINIHGGRIVVESTPGKQTSFHVFLPIRKAF
jgi:signal transduction histidine kinase